MAPTTFERATSKIERLRSTSDGNVINALLDVLVDAVDETTDASERKADLIKALEPTVIGDPDIHTNTSLLQPTKSVLSLNGIATHDTRDPLSDRIMHGLCANEPEKLSFGMNRLNTLRDERVSQRSTGQGATAALQSNPVLQNHRSALRTSRSRSRCRLDSNQVRSLLAFSNRLLRLRRSRINTIAHSSSLRSLRTNMSYTYITHWMVLLSRSISEAYTLTPGHRCRR
jgi:hypothetical protein